MATVLDPTTQASKRPLSFDNFMGQEGSKRLLRTTLKAKQLSREPFPHTLLQGPAGYGKTTLARIISEEMGVERRDILAGSLKDASDLAHQLTILKPYTVVFIDEVHGMPRACQEVLYPAMEDGVVSYTSGLTGSSISRTLPKFTLIGASTEAGAITTPFWDRFQIKVRLEDYDHETQNKLVKSYLGKSLIKEFSWDLDAVDGLATASRGVPRQIVTLVDRVQDHMIVADRNHLTLRDVQEVLQSLGITQSGLTAEDRRVIFALAFDFANETVGFQTLSLVSKVDEKTLRLFVEPYLVRLGIMELTSRGRKLGSKAHDYIGAEVEPEG